MKLNQAHKDKLMREINARVADSIDNFDMLLFIEDEIKPYKDQIETLCKYRTNLGYFEDTRFKDEDGNSPCFPVYTYEQSIRISYESLNDTKDHSESLKKAVKQVCDNFLELLTINQKERYEYVLRQNIQFKVFNDNFTYDKLITFFLRIRQIPDFKVDSKLTYSFNDLKMRKGENTPIKI